LLNCHTVEPRRPRPGVTLGGMNKSETSTRSVLVEVALPNRTALRIFGPLLDDGDVRQLVAALGDLPSVGAVEVNRWRGEVVCLHGGALDARELRATVDRLVRDPDIAAIPA
jgi:hypothetical protein